MCFLFPSKFFLKLSEAGRPLELSESPKSFSWSSSLLSNRFSSCMRHLLAPGQRGGSSHLGHLRSMQFIYSIEEYIFTYFKLCHFKIKYNIINVLQLYTFKFAERLTRRKHDGGGWLRRVTERVHRDPDVRLFFSGCLKFRQKSAERFWDGDSHKQIDIMPQRLSERLSRLFERHLPSTMLPICASPSRRVANPSFLSHPLQSICKALHWDAHASASGRAWSQLACTRKCLAAQLGFSLALAQFSPLCCQAARERHHQRKPSKAFKGFQLLPQPLALMK